MRITSEFIDTLLLSFIKKDDMSVVNLSTTHSNYDKTVETIKYIIDHSIDTMNGIVLEFSSDYTRVRKRLYYQI